MYSDGSSNWKANPECAWKWLCDRVNSIPLSFFVLSSCPFLFFSSPC
jgi:hypothetical protein